VADVDDSEKGIRVTRMRDSADRIQGFKENAQNHHAWAREVVGLRRGEIVQRGHVGRRTNCVRVRRHIPQRELVSVLHHETSGRKGIAELCNSPYSALVSGYVLSHPSLIPVGLGCAKRHSLDFN
jgi:hypothetical protein